MKVGKTIQGLFTWKNAVAFAAIVVFLVGLELLGYGVSANAERVRQVREGGAV